jgi:predicted enzyme related to lactoylglutathione lyase
MKKLGADTNSLNWFEIPVTNMERATQFYSTAFDIEMSSMPVPDMEMAVFPSMPPHSGGALVKSDMHKPSLSGSFIYLNGNPDLQRVLDKVPQAGGTIKMPKTNIGGDNGFMAFFEDSEGNMVGVHSNT